MRVGAGVRNHLRRVRTGGYSRHCAQRAAGRCARPAARNVASIAQTRSHVLRKIDAARPIPPVQTLDRRRTLATVSDAPEDGVLGPLQEYDRRVDMGILRNDEHQRGQ